MKLKHHNLLIHPAPPRAAFHSHTPLPALSSCLLPLSRSQQSKKRKEEQQQQGSTIELTISRRTTSTCCC
ncbi:hypothetical protein BDA96_02G243700 [Sorghum bicolor]|uniref:Uncharacterized protein n=1 Tax=Sorghum bicolor TaxID=4558 RepID=A0A921UUS2_SORBI|nr:hypothetical protein BDA96_02G243700 [Sorghum bicolor]